MNEETLRFVPGETITSFTLEVDLNADGSADTAAPVFVSEIHVIGEEVWIGRVTACGYTVEAAEALRDRLLWALQQPTVPTLWQYQGHVLTGEDEHGEPVYREVWRDLDNGGEAARLKGEGYEIRALYAKQPLKEV